MWLAALQIVPNPEGECELLHIMKAGPKILFADAQKPGEAGAATSRDPIWA
jgi:hypothetical protein